MVSKKRCKLLGPPFSILKPEALDPPSETFQTDQARNRAYQVRDEAINLFLNTWTKDMYTKQVKEMAADYDLMKMSYHYDAKSIGLDLHKFRTDLTREVEPDPTVVAGLARCRAR